MSWDDDDMPDSQIDELERQGCDVRELRATKAGRAAARAAEAQQRLIERQQRPRLQLERLQAFMATPRPADSQFFKDAAGKPPMLFGKKTWQTSHENAPIVFAATVQANEKLWDPGDENGLPLVLVTATDPRHRNDVAYLTGLARRLAELRDSSHTPSDCQKLVASLRDQQSIFNWKVGASVAGDADAWCGTLNVTRRNDLPNRCLPADGVLPYLLLAPPRDNYNMDLKLVPKQYYS
jgi:hypothetical protein